MTHGGAGGLVLACLFCGGLACATSTPIGEPPGDVPDGADRADRGEVPADSADAPDACRPGLAFCGGVCVDTTSNPAHCGSCGHACAATEVCNEGACVTSCGGLTPCGGACVNTATDPANCGSCGNACPDGLNADGVCEMSRCVLACREGWQDRDGVPGCETACATTPAEESCNGVDDDCDGATDEGFPCAAGWATTCTASCGTSGTGTCTLACTPPPASACTPPPESCNARDDDCDTLCDDGFVCCQGVRESGAACGAGGHLERTCGGVCAWSEWTCVGEGVCIPGTTRPCGTCGTETCRADGYWGDCTGGGVCTPGATQPCGACGTQTCSPSCTWGACSGDGACCQGFEGGVGAWSIVSTSCSWCPPGGYTTAGTWHFVQTWAARLAGASSGEIRAFSGSPVGCCPSGNTTVSVRSGTFAATGGQVSVWFRADNTWTACGPGAGTCPGEHAYSSAVVTIIIGDGSSSSETEVFGSDEWTSPCNNHENHAATATGADGQTWYDFVFTIPGGWDTSRLYVEVRATAGSWRDVCNETLTFYVDNVGPTGCTF